MAFAYDFGARMYDARVGRFLSVDPDWKQYPQWSPYLFAGENPVTLIDENGEGPINPMTGKRISSNIFKIPRWHVIWFDQQKSNSPDAEDPPLRRAASFYYNSEGELGDDPDLYTQRHDVELSEKYYVTDQSGESKDITASVETYPSGSPKHWSYSLVWAAKHGNYVFVEGAGIWSNQKQFSVYIVKDSVIDGIDKFERNKEGTFDLVSETRYEITKSEWKTEEVSILAFEIKYKYREVTATSRTTNKKTGEVTTETNKYKEYVE